jgi:5'-3' exonuclease
MTLEVPDLPFKSPKTEDKRDNELALERLNSKIKEAVSEIVVQTNTDIEALESQLTGDIATLQTQVTTNTTDIATNVADIATNVANISTNTTALLTKVEEDPALAAIVLPEPAQDGTVQSQSSGGVQNANNLEDQYWNRGGTGGGNLNLKGWHGVFTEKFQAIYDNQVELRDKINEIVTIING